jgi:peptidyl-prolyl cis-trans isomerase C
LQKAQKSAVDLRAKAKIEVVDPVIKKAVDDRNAMIAKQSEPAKAPAAEAPKEAPKDAPKP